MKTQKGKAVLVIMAALSVLFTTSCGGGGVTPPPPGGGGTPTAECTKGGITSDTTPPTAGRTTKTVIALDLDNPDSTKIFRTYRFEMSVTDQGGSGMAKVALIDTRTGAVLGVDTTAPYVVDYTVGIANNQLAVWMVRYCDGSGNQTDNKLTEFPINLKRSDGKPTGWIGTTYGKIKPGGVDYLDILVTGDNGTETSGPLVVKLINTTSGVETDISADASDGVHRIAVTNVTLTTNYKLVVSNGLGVAESKATITVAP